MWDPEIFGQGSTGFPFLHRERPKSSKTGRAPGVDTHLHDVLDEGSLREVGPMALHDGPVPTSADGRRSRSLEAEISQGVAVGGPLCSLSLFQALRPSEVSPTQARAPPNGFPEPDPTHDLSPLPRLSGLRRRCPGETRGQRKRLWRLRQRVAEGKVCRGRPWPHFPVFLPRPASKRWGQGRESQRRDAPAG